MADQRSNSSSLSGAGSSSSSSAYAAAAAAAGDAAAGAAASSGTCRDNNEDEDRNLARRRLRTLDQLTGVFGFTMEMAEQAVDAVGFSDINLCYNYILDNGAPDQGGPITPIETCPHIRHHVKLSLDQLQSIQPHATTCQHVVTTPTAAAAAAASSSSVGRYKSDLQDDGNCPGTENWLCLECGQIGCSRYVNGHGLVHWEQTKAAAEAAAAATAAASSSNNEHDVNDVVDTNGHCVAVSLADLSVWCYVCNAYLRHPSLSAITRKLETLKFDDDTTAAAPTTTIAGVTVKEPERKKARQLQVQQQQNNEQENEDDDDDDDDDDRSAGGRSPARGVELNLEITGEEDEAELFRMIAAAAAAQGIPLQWILASQQGQSHDDDDDKNDENEDENVPIEYPFEQLPKSLSELADFIKSDKCRNILILAGAGMSVAAGIPDFRSSDGLYATMNANALTCTNPAQREAIRRDPSTALDQHLFLENPLPCLESQREFILGTRAQRWKATLAHRFVELLHSKTGKLVRLYTQNIDGLEDQCTQLPQDKVIAVHGSMDRAECARCASRMDFGQFCTLVEEQIKDLTGKDMNAPMESTPITCPTCGYNSVKPAIVLFRSNLPKQFFENLPNDVKDVDLLLIFGTSLKVAPANSLVWRVPKSAMRVLVNREHAGEHLGLNLYQEDDDDVADDDHDANNNNVNGNTDKDNQQVVEAALGAAAGAASARRIQKQRDYYAEGDCDEVLLDLMIALGWVDDLKPLLSNHALPASSETLLSKRLGEHSQDNTTSHIMKSNQQQPYESSDVNMKSNE